MQPNNKRDDELPEIDTDVTARDRVEELAEDIRDHANELADDIREGVPVVAARARAEINEFAQKTRTEVHELSDRAHDEYRAATATPAKRREMKYWVSIAIAAIIGLILGFILDRDNQAMQHNAPEMSMEQMMQHMSSGLDGLSGEQLEQKFIADMIIHHAGAVDMATKLVGGAGVTNDALRALAADIIRTQSVEIEQMKAWVK